ncbi:sulfurtransferase, partial [Pseudomonas sp. BGM005]|nr:sulfurtransferase [Pseudomonas sp. BG5]
MIDCADYFAARLAYETDASDVHAALSSDDGPVIIDVRSEAAWAQGRVAGAVHMHYSQIAARAPREIPLGTSVVVYCWSPGCNAGSKG